MKDLIQTLREIGYEPVLKDAASIFAQSSDAVFLKFGEKIKEDILSHIKSYDKRLVQDPFPYYSVTRDLFSELFDDEAAAIVIETIRKDMLLRINMDTKENIEKVLDTIQKKELFSYLRNMTGHEHIIFLWSKPHLRDNIMKKFFIQSIAPQGLMSIKEEKPDNIETVTYQEIFADKERATEYGFNTISHIHEKNTELIHPTRLAGIDCTQWFKQGLTEEFICLEEKIDKFSEKNKISCICGYDINKIPDKRTLKKVIKSHGYVMLDNPHMLFKSGI